MREPSGSGPGKASIFVNYHFTFSSEARSLTGMVIMRQLLRG